MMLHIKNMVCDRCVLVVRKHLEALQLDYKQVQMGQVELRSEPSPGELFELRLILEENGFELLDDKKSKTVERIKNVIVSLIHRKEEESNFKLSAILEEKLQLDYHYLTTLFSSVVGLTIEKYAILQRIERVKELLMYEEESLSEIAFRMGYSSVQHLSLQFKKVTGFTPSQFRELKEKKRKPLDKI
jgi:AraC family transcriptional regulator